MRLGSALPALVKGASESLAGRVEFVELGETGAQAMDVLTGTFMVRQVQPWFANVNKRQVKSPTVYPQDTGLLHGLLGHPRVEERREGFALE